MRRRNVLLMATIAVMACAMVGGTTGRIAIQTHDLGDPTPCRVEATVALGNTAMVFLVTWTSRID